MQSYPKSTTALFVFASLFLVSLGLDDPGKVGHDDIPPIHHEIKHVNDGRIKKYMKFQPSINVKHGCVPFPAVGKNTQSGGLKDSGAHDGLCSRSPGQTYVRYMKMEGGVNGVMYGYYFPKDSGLVGGHRHDWEEVIVWATKDWKKAKGASMSGHGGYTHSKNNWCDSLHKKVQYNLSHVEEKCWWILCTPKLAWVGNQEFRSTNSSPCSYKHPIAAWEYLPETYRNALAKGDWGAASPKFTNEKFEDKMNDAWKEFKEQIL